MNKETIHQDKMNRLKRQTELLEKSKWSDADRLEYMLLSIEPYSWYWRAGMKKALKKAIKLLKQSEELENDTHIITSNFKDFEINSSPSKTIISCEGCYCLEDTNTYNTEETIENCTVKIWSNSDTGNVKISWWKNDK